MSSSLAISAPVRAELQPILSSEAMEFVSALVERFGPRVSQLLQVREERQRRLDAGELPDFLPETREIRESEWRVAPIPQDLLDRRVEITGPTERKMVINALNSGAKVFMADCEDSLAPTWENVVAGQENLRDAVRRTIEYASPEGKKYKLNPQTALLASEREARDARRAAGARRTVRFRAVPVSQRARAHQARHGAVFLPAEAREP